VWALALVSGFSSVWSGRWRFSAHEGDVVVIDHVGRRVRTAAIAPVQDKIAVPLACH
jgi:hypothetical protein